MRYLLNIAPPSNPLVVAIGLTAEFEADNDTDALEYAQSLVGIDFEESWECNGRRVTMRGFLHQPGLDDRRIDLDDLEILS